MAVVDRADIRQSPIVMLAGQVDGSRCVHVSDVLTALVDSGYESPRVDLCGVDFMDSEGLLGVIKWSGVFNRLEVISVNPTVRRLFEAEGRGEMISQSMECSPPERKPRQPVTDCFAAAGDREIRSFSVIASLESCKVVRDKITEMARGTSFTDEECIELKTAVGEAISNAIKHGCKNDSSKTATVRCMATADCIAVEVADDGPGFNLDSVHQPPSGAPAESGMGIKCMRRSVDELSFNFERGTTVRLIKRARSSAYT